MWPLLLGALGVLGSGLISGAVASKQNKENIEFQQKENEIAREREDNAVQRYVQDSILSGYSPLAGIQSAGAKAMTAPQNTVNPVEVAVNSASTALNMLNSLNSAKLTEAKYQNQLLQNQADAEYLMKDRKLGYAKNGMGLLTDYYNYQLSNQLNVRTTDHPSQWTAVEGILNTLLGLPKKGSKSSGGLTAEQVAEGNETFDWLAGRDPHFAEVYNLTK